MLVFEIIGHVFILLGIFLAILGIGISFFYYTFVKGGLAGKGFMMQSIGLTVIVIDIILLYTSISGGNSNLLQFTLLWPILGLFILVGFFLVTFGQYILIKVVR
jgi:hypothetical protein